MIIAFMWLLFLILIMAFFSKRDLNEDLRNYPYKSTAIGIVIILFLYYILNFGMFSSVIIALIISFYYDYRTYKNSNK